MYEFWKEFSLRVSSNSKNKVKKVNQFLDSHFFWKISSQKTHDIFKAHYDSEPYLENINESPTYQFLFRHLIQFL